MKKLSFKALPKIEPRTGSLDISRAFGEKSGETVLQWSEPTTAQKFNAPAMVPALQRKNSEWTPALCATVALLALCHISPETDCDPLVFYTELANGNSALFMAVAEAFNNAFPDLQDFGAAVQDAKNV